MNLKILPAKGQGGSRAAAEARYASNDMIGYEDLYGQGSWRTVPGMETSGISVWHRAGLHITMAIGRGLSPGGGLGSTTRLGGSLPFHYGRWAYAGAGMAVESRVRS